MNVTTLCLLLCAVATVGLCRKTNSVPSSHRLAVYWGQNAVSHKLYPPKNYEADLMHFCLHSKYDTIIIAFLYVFFDARNKDSLPSINLSYHCNTTVSAKYPFLLKCPNVSDAIQVCQKNGKQVMLSLGGAAGAYGFYHPSEPGTFAYRVWNLFLGGTELASLRPFGKAVMDGVDLDIEGGSIDGYGDFVKHLRGYMKSDQNRNYSITAAPQCLFPDAFIGPSGKSVLQEAESDIDAIYVQFYNNYCTTGSPKYFWPAFKQWLNYTVSTNGPKLFIGVPSSKGGASRSDADYRTPNELKQIYDKVKLHDKFGGFMLWEASFDQNNVIAGKVYSDYVADILAGRCPGVGPVSPTTPPTSKPATTLSPLDRQCLKSGIIYFPHPTNCRQFYHCSNGRAYLRSCSSNLVWNQKILSCDWPSNVICHVQGDETGNVVENLWNID